MDFMNGSLMKSDKLKNGPNIHLSANREDEEPHRIERLQKVYEYLIDEDNDGMCYNINSLHDHKGILTVEWLNFPEEAWIKRVYKAWYSQNEIYTRHVIIEPEYHDHEDSDYTGDEAEVVFHTKGGSKVALKMGDPA